MPLIVHTARVSYAGPDRLDVTRKSAGPEGIAFAPSWDILNPALEHREAVRQFCSGNPAVAATLEHAMWRLYRAAYRGEMRESYRTQRAAWDAVLRRERVVLVCYCGDPSRCHRTLLASILAKLGATNAGEVQHG